MLKREGGRCNHIHPPHRCSFVFAKQGEEDRSSRREGSLLRTRRSISITHSAVLTYYYYYSVISRYDTAIVVYDSTATTVIIVVGVGISIELSNKSVPWGAGEVLKGDAGYHTTQGYHNLLRSDTTWGYICIDYRRTRWRNCCCHLLLLAVFFCRCVIS